MNLQKAKGTLRHLKGYPLPVSILTLAILGSRLANEYVLYTMIGMICLAIGLVAFGKIERKFYSYIIFSIGLSLLYQTTLFSPYIVGTDNHGEVFHAWKVLSTGKWDYTDPFAYNTALGSTLLSPLITTVFKIPLDWVFKAVLPIFLATASVVVYFIFKRFFGATVAFLSAIFFLIIPTYTMELPAIGKEQVAELLFVLCLYLLLVPRFRLSVRIPLIVLLGILTSLAHYTVGIILLIFLIGLLVMLPFFKNRLIPIRYLSLAVVVILVASLGFFSWVASGYTMAKINYIGITTINMLPGVELERTPLPARDTTTETPAIEKPTEGVPTEDVPTEVAPVEDIPVKEIPVKETSAKVVPEKPKLGYFDRHGTVIKKVWGADFADATPLGKFYRVLQYATQLLVIVGGAYIFIRRKKLGLTPEYCILFIIGWGILGLCLFLPGFSSIANATRFYHFALYLLAPAFVLGGLLLFRNYKLLLIILIPYFLFTSGLIFEVSKVDNIEKLEIPYVHALSAIRVDTTGIATQSDGAAREWLLANRDESYEIFGDIHAIYFLVERFGPVSGLNYFPWYLDAIPNDSYIFLREWNGFNGKVTYWTGVGVRKSVPYTQLDWSTKEKNRPDYWKKLLDGREILYEKGEAKIYGPK